MSLDFHYLKAFVCVCVCVCAYICHPTSHAEQSSCFPMQILFQVNWFYRTRVFRADTHVDLPAAVVFCFFFWHIFFAHWLLWPVICECMHICLPQCVIQYIYKVQSIQDSMCSCIHWLPVGNCSNSQFSLYRLVLPMLDQAEAEHVWCLEPQY